MKKQKNAIEKVKEYLVDVEEDNKRLFSGCELALKTLNELTSEDFSLGKDEQIRDYLTNVLLCHHLYFDREI